MGKKRTPNLVKLLLNIKVINAAIQRHSLCCVLGQNEYFTSHKKYRLAENAKTMSYLCCQRDGNWTKTEGACLLSSLRAAWLGLIQNKSLRNYLHPQQHVVTPAQCLSYRHFSPGGVSSTRNPHAWLSHPSGIKTLIQNIVTKYCWKTYPHSDSLSGTHEWCWSLTRVMTADRTGSL